MTDETYTCLCVSTGHLTETDAKVMEAYANDRLNWMVTSREPGFFMKLYDNREGNHYAELSDTANDLIAYAFDKGHRLIEIDRDGPVLDGVPVFDW